MTTMRAAGVLLAADPGNRRLTYRLLPYGEPGRTSLGTVTASRGSVRIPQNLGDVVLTIEHEPEHPVGLLAAAADQDDALIASFDILPTRAGDDLLTEAEAGVRTGASVVLGDPVIRAGHLRDSLLAGAGAVVEPAFPSAQLVAADTGDDTPAADTGDTDTDTDDADSPADQGEDHADNPDTDSTDDTDSEADMTTTTTTSPAAAGTSAALTAARAPAGLPAQTRAPEPGFRDIVRFLADRSRRSMDGRLYAALSDITPGAGSVNDITQVPQWLGELWDGRQYRQRYLPLLTHADITAMEIKGWKWTVKPEVGPWAGNKTDVPSNAASTEPYTQVPHRIAGAHDIDRIFRDFGVEEFWSSYWEAMRESYARQADYDVRDFLVTEAPYVAPGAVPTDVSTAATYIVDGALAIIDVAIPTFAVVSKDLYRELLLTRNDDMLTYLNLALGLEEGTIKEFQIVPGGAPFPAASVLVGAREAGTVHELPGSPLRAEALDIQKGGVDVGAFGYIAEVLNDDTGLAFVSAADPRPPLAEDEEKAPARKTRSRRRQAAAE